MEHAWESSGLTFRLILDYVERHGGGHAVREVLERCGASGREEALRDEDAWFPFQLKIAMFRAASEVLGDPETPRRIGQSAIEANVAPALKAALRALGSPRMVYANAPRANGKFSIGHRMELLELGDDEARFRFRDAFGRCYEPEDCLYNVGLLRCVPGLFGLPFARVDHTACALDGAEACVFHVRWDERPIPTRFVVGGSLAAVAAGVLAVVTPPLAPVAVAAVAAVGLLGTARASRTGERRLRMMRTSIEQQAEAHERLRTSLGDLVSDLRLDEVLAKIVTNASATAAGKEFAVLVDDGDGVRCRGSSRLSPRTAAALERWAATAPECMSRSVVVDRLAGSPLGELADDPAGPFGSLCSVPLEGHWGTGGALVSLARMSEIFLPQDIGWLSEYAMHAAIALRNARVYEAQQALASRDPLTGLLNHREFHERVAAELERCRRHGGRFAVALFDLDGFKAVNDLGGHAEGDRVLRTVASLLDSACRGSDAAFRLGGDEFALVLPETASVAAEAVVERIRSTAPGRDPRIRLSTGVASWPQTGPTKEALLARADGDLYASKRRLREPAAWTMPGRSASGQDARKRLEATSRIAARLAVIQEPDAIAEVAVRELHEVLGHPLVVIGRFRDGVIEHLAVAGDLIQDATGLPALPTARAGVVGRVLRTGEPALVPDTATDPDFVPVSGGQPVGSELCVPIRVGGEIWGALNLEELETHAFDFGDLLFADTVAGQIGAALDRSRLYGELENTFVRTLAVLCDALERKDPYTAWHARTVAELSERVARRLGMPEDQVRTVGYAGLLHDIGKISVRTEVLEKPGPLDPAETAEMQQHTVVGAAMLEQIPFFDQVHPLVRSAHEHWDGRGYPDGLAGEAVPLGARIISACDAWHAMISERPYRAPLSTDDALCELRSGAGSQFDSRVVDALLSELGAEDGADPAYAAAGAPVASSPLLSSRTFSR